MSFIADLLLAAGAFAAAFYCLVLSRRLRRFADLEKGVGGAVAALSAQVDDLTKSLTAAQKTAGDSVGTLTEVSERAEKAARRLELLVAAMHDVEKPETPPVRRVLEKDTVANPFFVRSPTMQGSRQ